jgi:hypothetical protein
MYSLLTQMFVIIPRQPNPPKFVHTLSISIYPSNQCIKIAVEEEDRNWATGKVPGEAFLRHDLVISLEVQFEGIV